MTVEELTESVELYGSDLYNFCCYVTGNQLDADDLYQETFLKATELRKKIKTSENVKSFLMGIAINIQRNQKRKKQRMDYMEGTDLQEEHLEIQDQRQIEEDYIYKELLKEVRNIISALPQKHKEVALLYYSGSLSTKEIAEALHLPKGTVISRLNKVKKNLKTSLEAKGYEI